jgi:hypothetical protein
MDATGRCAAALRLRAIGSALPRASLRFALGYSSVAALRLQKFMANSQAKIICQTWIFMRLCLESGHGPKDIYGTHKSRTIDEGC